MSVTDAQSGYALLSATLTRLPIKVDISRIMDREESYLKSYLKGRIQRMVENKSNQKIGEE
jgi:hypothetical protein